MHNTTKHTPLHKAIHTIPMLYAEAFAGSNNREFVVELYKDAQLLETAVPAMYEALKMARWLSNECECHESWNAPEGNLCGHCTADLAIKTALSQAEGK